MNCPHCGAEYQQGELFCTECGAQLPSAVDATVSVTGSGGIAGAAAGLTPGTTLQNGRYVISQMLGEGGMGSVMLAKDTRLADKPIVIKALSADNTNTQKLQEDVHNFKREAETLAHLRHPLIPAVTDHFEEGTRYYMVMDYVEGENLEHWLERMKKPMQEDEALKYTLEVLDILEYLAKQQPAIVHRDIKPANIIIGDKDKHAHLVDFGIARANTLVNGQRRKTTALGTPGYAPPEQYQGYADPRSDLYALAATLHHLVTNRDPGDYPPFQFPAARTLNPRVSRQLEQILDKALKASASERYQSAVDMRQDIESLIAGTSTIGNTDGYRLSGTLNTRTAPSPSKPPQPVRSTQSDPFARSTDPFASTTRPGRSTQGRQQQQQEFEYANPDNYQNTQRSRPRSVYETARDDYEAPQPRPLRQYPPRQQNNPFTYNNQRPVDDNQLMWRFIGFVVIICIIALLAYVLFSSLPFMG
jgi:serine/threonine protein kinase